MEPCQLQFVCGKRWTDLSAIPLSGARFCGDCKQAVFLVKTSAQLSLASAVGRCVGIADDNDFVGVIGDPGALGSFDWMEPGYYDEVELRYEGRPGEAQLQTLRLLLPSAMNDAAEKSLSDGLSVSLGSLGFREREALRQELEACLPAAALRAVPA